MNTADLQSLLETAFVWTWGNSIAATVVVLLVVLVQWLLRRRLPATWQYALGLLVVARLVLPTSPASPISLFNLQDHFGHEGARRVTLPVLSPTSARSHQDVVAGHPTATTDTAPTEKPPVLKATDVSKTSATPDGRVNFVRIAAQLWALGAVAYLAVVLAAHRRLARSLQNMLPPSDKRMATLVVQSRTALDLKREVQVIESPHIHTPAVFGFVRPRLLLPNGLSQRLTDDQLRLVILHELIHVKRRDVLQNWLLIGVQVLHWFNPIVWLALRRLRADRELVCDAAVLVLLNPAERHTYGDTLIKLAEQLTHAARSPLAPGLVPILCHKPEIE